uniref:F-box domain-containing protein n=1 Tax=Panagrellus redivivus TaxID=6233 RepID=A0A7E4UXV3_PANRE
MAQIASSSTKSESDSPADMAMIVFPFQSLPLVAQDLIAEFIVDTLTPQTALNFSLASRHCLWLRGRARPRPIVEKGQIVFKNGDIAYVTEVDGYEETVGKEFFHGCRLSGSGGITIETDDTAIDNFVAALPELKVVYRFIKRFHIKVKSLPPHAADALADFVASLKHLDTIECLGRNWDDTTTFPVTDFLKTMRKHSRFIFMRANDVDDDVLRVLASKTSEENPLKTISVFSRKEITVDGFADFINNTTFASNAQISLYPLNVPRKTVIEILSKHGTVTAPERISAINMRNDKTELMVCMQPTELPQAQNVGLLPDLRNLFRPQRRTVQ